MTYTPPTVAEALRELTLLTECRCGEEYMARAMHGPHCLTDWREDVDALRAAVTQKPDPEASS